MDINTHIGDLDAVRRRRAELRDTLGDLERAMAAPAGGRAAIWGEQVLAAVGRVSAEFAEHVVVTEGPDGLHQNIMAGDLRLANAVDALATEHVTIAADIAALALVCEVPITAADAAEVREQGMRVLGRLARHRQRGADLIYEAYATDIGGAD